MEAREHSSLGYEFAREEEARGAAAERLHDARALLGESGAPVHPEDLRDYKRASERGGVGGLPDWIRRLFGS